MSEWAHKFTKGRKTRDGYVVVTAGLHKLDGNAHPYFSVTCEIWDSKGWYENGQDGRCRGGGADHEAVLRAFPSLAPVVALHLSDDNGTPMHAAANGRYWIEKGELEIAARHFRCAVEDLPAADAVDAYVDAQRDRWQNEAAAAIALLDGAIAAQARARLEELRGELRAERISYGELAELQALAPYIEPGDVELLEAAGVPEHAV